MPENPALTNPAVPTPAQVRGLPLTHEETVPEDWIDENGHMNITHYFRLGAWSPWARLRELGLTPAYLEAGHSFFTVEHHIRYLGELRLGDALTLHAGFVGRTERALHAVAFVLDPARDRLACVIEVMYVHVSTQTRRAVPVLADLGAAIDAEMATYTDQTWLPAAATGLSLR